MAVVGRRLPGMIPRASTLMMKSAALKTKTSHAGRVPASGNGHNTGEPPLFLALGAIPEGTVQHSLSGTGRTKLEA